MPNEECEIISPFSFSASDALFSKTFWNFSLPLQ
jgi:hypothetical protein